MSGRIWRISASSRLGWRALIVSVAEAYAAAGGLLGLLVERPAERLEAFQAGAGGVGDPEPGGAHLDRRVVGAHEVPADEQLGAVGHAERVGHLGRRRRPADLGEVLPVTGGEVGVVAAVPAVAAAGEPVEPAPGAADVRARSRAW